MMRAKKPITKVMSASQVRQHFAETVNEAARGEADTIIEKNGVPIAAVISSRDFERLQKYYADREERFKILDEVRAAFAGIPDEELEREALKAVAEAREDIRREREKQQLEIA